MSENQFSSLSNSASTAIDERLARLYRENFDFVWRSLRRLGLSPDAADDGAQQVFWVAAGKLKRVAAEKERSFLFGCALRVAADVRKAERRQPQRGSEAQMLAASDPSPSPEDRASQTSARRQLEEVLETLPLELRAAFVLFELEAMTMADMAKLLELPPGTVASRIRRARELFQRAVARLRAQAHGESGP